MESEMKCTFGEMWGHKITKKMDLEISHHPLTMKRVANLIITIEKIKSHTSESVLSTDFRDENLLSILLENIVEEHIVYECESTPSGVFTKTSEHPCSVTDSQKRSLVFFKDTLELNAVMLQGGSENRKVYLNMSTYVYPEPITSARPVALSIKDTKYYLSCRKDGDTPTLHLEQMDKSNLTSISSDSDNVRFLFYKQDTGKNVSTLKSARFPEWYITTAVQENQPLEMCKTSANRYRTFNIQRQS